MIKNFVIFSLLIVAINAAGEFSVLSSPKALSFKGNEALDSQYVGDVLKASIGKPISGDANWGGLIIDNPFDMAKGVVAVVIDGAEHVSVSSNARTYPLEGNQGANSINDLVSELEEDNVAVCSINFNQFEEAISSYQSCFGKNAVSNIEETKYLNPSTNNGVKQFLQSIAYIKTASENLSNMLKSSNFLVVHIPLTNVIKAYGEKSDAMTEALKLVSTVIANLNTAATKSSSNSALVVTVAEKSVNIRPKREAITAEQAQQYNLSEYYSPEYPVIFNIILWFMVAFGLSLLAICYAIGSMDPGRDSIIYRMTSTRMKKDN